MGTSYAKPEKGFKHRTVSEIRRGVKSLVHQSQVLITGECIAPRRTDSRWNFDLASVSAGRVDLLPCTIWDEQSSAIEKTLENAGLSLQEALTDGMVLKLSGSTWLSRDGRVCLRVTDVVPDFSREGHIYLEDQRSLRALEAAGASADRLFAPYVHSDSERAFEKMTRGPERIMVLAPENSQGLGDFKRRLGSGKHPKPEVTFRGFSWPAAGIQTLRNHLSDAASADLDMVIILRGGGHWSDLRGYGREDLALVIHRSKVPVATAVGHDVDITLADRAAALSFATPTAAAEAISNELRRRYWAKKKLSSRPSERKKGHLAHGSAASHLTLAAKGRERLRENSEWKVQKTNLQQAVAAANLHRRAADQKLRDAFYLHTKDLLEDAEQRVRMISQFLTFGTLAAVSLLLVSARSVFELLFGIVEDGALWSYCLGAAAAGGALVWLQRRERQNIMVPATKMLKDPPADVEAWRFAIKRVKTINSFRKLRLHKPY